MVEKVRGMADSGLREAYAIASKQERRDGISLIKEKIVKVDGPKVTILDRGKLERLV